MWGNHAVEMCFIINNVFFNANSSCVNYVPEPENSALLKCALSIFRKFNRYPEALRLALMLNDVELVENIFTSCKDMYDAQFVS